MSETKIYNALNGLQEAVFVVDQERRILFANTIAESVFGKTLIGSDFVRTIRHPQLMSMIEQALHGATLPSETIRMESHVSSTFNVLVTKVIDDNGTQIVIALTDISEQHHNEQMRKDFVANVSHELRSPLTALAGFIETLQGPAKHDQMARERFLLSMERETSRMSRLVSDLLSLSRLEADQNIMPKEKCDIIRIAQRVTGLLDQLAKSETKGLKLKLEDVELFVSGNSDALTQLFRNLIENAIKYSADHSEVEVDVSCKKDIAGMNGPTVAITIKDRGYGIPKEHIARLTERFYRVDTDRSRDKGGTGLGLAIVKHIVNQHRGRLKIQSEIGVGSTFTVYLPLLS